MLVTRKSKLTGNITAMELPVSPAELDRFDSVHAYFLYILARLTSEQREFILTGVTPEELDAHAIYF